MQTTWAEMERQFASKMWAAYQEAGMPFGDSEAGSVQWSETVEGSKHKSRIAQEVGIIDRMIAAAFPTIIEVMQSKGESDETNNL